MLDWIARALLVCAAVLGLTLSFIVCADVIGRVVFNTPLKGTPELVSSAIVIICFMQAPYAIRSGGMINVDFIVQHLSWRWQSGLAAFGAVLGGAFFGFILWGAVEPAVSAWKFMIKDSSTRCWPGAVPEPSYSKPVTTPVLGL